MMQLQNLCVKGNLVSSGNRATLIDRLLDSYGPRQLQLIKKLYAAPSVEPLPLVSTPELNNNGQQKTSSQIPSDTLVAEVEYKNAQNVGVEDNSMSFPCNFCESGFPTRTSLKNHTRRAHKKQRREMSEVELIYKGVQAHMAEENLGGQINCNSNQSKGLKRTHDNELDMGLSCDSALQSMQERSEEKMPSCSNPLKEELLAKSKSLEKEIEVRRQIADQQAVNRQIAIERYRNSLKNTVKQLENKIQEAQAKEVTKSNLGAQITCSTNQSQGSHSKSTPDLNGPEVVKRVEKRLASLESSLRTTTVAQRREKLKQKIDLAKSKLQRYYFLAQLVPLSRSQQEYAAFIEHYVKQRSNKSQNKVIEGVHDKQIAPRNGEKQGHKASWVPISGHQHAAENNGEEPSVVRPTNQGLINLINDRGVKPRRDGESNDFTVIQAHREGDGDGGKAGGDFGGNSYETMVPGHLVARIIGPGGQMIKALMGETGVKMVIIQDSSGYKKEKPLRITGPPDKIRAAKRRVEQVISEEQLKMGGYNIVNKLSDESWSRCYNIVYKLSDESWNKFCKWRSFGGPSESNLKELENVTGATFDRMDYREQTISVSGCQGALNKLVDTLKLTLQGNFGMFKELSSQCP